MFLVHFEIHRSTQVWRVSGGRTNQSIILSLYTINALNKGQTVKCYKIYSSDYKVPNRGKIFVIFVELKNFITRKNYEYELNTVHALSDY